MASKMTNPLERFISIDPVNPQSDIIDRAVGVLKTGGVIMFPTHSLYGLGANALEYEAVEKVFDIKQRSFDNPLPVLVDTLEEVEQLVKSIPENAWRLMENFWPGGVTLIFDAQSSVLTNLTAGMGKIGIRMPEHAVARALCNQTGGPITATSANVSGLPAYDRVDTIDPSVAAKLDLILDAGPLPGGPGSTIVDVTVDPPEILREGRIPAVAVLAALG